MPVIHGILTTETVYHHYSGMSLQSDIENSHILDAVLGHAIRLYLCAVQVKTAAAQMEVTIEGALEKEHKRHWLPLQITLLDVIC